MLTALLLFDSPGKTRKLLNLARRRFDLDDAREVKAAGAGARPEGLSFCLGLSRHAAPIRDAKM